VGIGSHGYRFAEKPFPIRINPYQIEEERFVCRVEHIAQLNISANTLVLADNEFIVDINRSAAALVYFATEQYGCLGTNVNFVGFNDCCFYFKTFFGNEFPKKTYPQCKIPSLRAVGDTEMELFSRDVESEDGSFTVRAKNVFPSGSLH